METVNLEMSRGDTYERDFQVLSGGIAVSLTGAEIRLTAKWLVSDTDANAAFAIDTLALGGITIIDAANGKFRISIVPGKTTALPPERVDLDYDTQVKLSNGKVHTVLRGIFTVFPDPTIAS